MRGPSRMSGRRCREGVEQAPRKLSACVIGSNCSLTAGRTAGLSIQQTLSTNCVHSLVSMLGKQHEQNKVQEQTLQRRVEARRHGHRHSHGAAGCLLCVTLCALI